MRFYKLLKGTGCVVSFFNPFETLHAFFADIIIQHI